MKHKMMKRQLKALYFDFIVDFLTDKDRTRVTAMSQKGTPPLAYNAKNMRQGLHSRNSKIWFPYTKTIIET